MKKRINSRQKGKRIEREACKFLASIGFPGFQRTAQNCGKSGDAADVRPTDPAHPLAHIHFEIKGDESIDVGTKALSDACAQAKRDASGRKWFVLWKRKRSGWRMSFVGYNARTKEVLVTVSGEDIKTAVEGYIQ